MPCSKCCVAALDEIDAAWQMTLMASPRNECYRPNTRVSDGPFVSVICIMDERFVDLLDAVITTKNTTTPLSAHLFSSPRRMVETYHCSATRLSSSLIIFSLFTPVLNPRLTSFCRSLIYFFFPNLELSSTFFPKQSL